MATRKDNLNVLSLPQGAASVGSSSDDSGTLLYYSSFLKSMEHNISKTLTHQRSMIEVPQGIFDLQHELHGNSDDEDNDEDSQAPTDASVEIKDDSDEEESFDLDDDEPDLNNPEMRNAIGKAHDPSLSSDEDDDDNVTDSEMSHSRDRSGAKTESPFAAATLGDDANNPPILPRRVSPYANKRSSEIAAPTSPTSNGSPMRSFKHRTKPGYFDLNTKNNNDTNVPPTGNNDNNNSNTDDDSKNVDDNDTSNNDNNNLNTNDTEKDKSVSLKDSTPSHETGDIEKSDRRPSQQHPRRSTKHRHSSKRRSTRNIHRATIANDFDDDANSDDDFNTFKSNDNEPSLTMDFDIEQWKTPTEGEFEECDLRFDEDDIQGGKKPPASEFRHSKLFFHFFFDRFHHNGTLLMETSLPTYHEWKTSRKVKFRNQAIKRIDYCLKACQESVHSLRSMCYNCVLLCYDAGQNMEVHYPGCQAPKISPCVFDVGVYSIISCWDLFELGASPSGDDWRRALSNDCVAQFLCHAQPDLRHFEKEQRKELYTFQIIKKYQLYCLAEHMHQYCLQSGFGASMEWKKIKTQFLKKCDKDILNAIDQYTYYLNPKVDNLAQILSDTANSTLVASKRKIICEPILWLIYVGYYLLDRQQKLQELVFSSYHYQDTNTKVKGQKLKTMIDNLAKQAKDESERLRKLMAKLPSQEDLQKTFELEIVERDPQSKHIYTRSFKREFVVSTKQSMTEITKGKKT